jgi:tetratricopeptide (TPR) repeat protein
MQRVCAHPRRDIVSLSNETDYLFRYNPMTRDVNPLPPMPERTPRDIAEDHYYAALDLFADGKHEEAVVEYEKSTVADPTFIDALHGLARAYQDMERYDDAIATAKRIAELDKDDVLAHTSLSILYQKKGMVPEAEEEANKARILGWKQQLKKGDRG